MTTDAAAIEAIRDHVIPVEGAAGDYDALFDAIGSARFVLLGEATHGTHEFYRERMRITQHLVKEKGFDAVAVEADWPDAYRAGCWARAMSDDPDAETALSGFRRFPTWMWRNTVVVELLEWMRQLNADRREQDRVGFYGIDLYSLYASVEAVLAYLEKVDPDAARRARERYACFDHTGGDAQSYGMAAAFGAGDSCEDDVVAQLVDLCREAFTYVGRDGGRGADDFFSAEQNARVVQNAERYYRSMFQGRISTWNLRDRHMSETLSDLADHVARRTGRRGKVVVWEHNSHLGDARATEMGDAGEHNVGQLMRERYLDEVFNVGFSTFTGSVTAADDWGGDARYKQVQPGLPGSYEALFHDADVGDFLLVLQGGGPAADQLRRARLQRAIGVIYRPLTERVSHYFNARLSDQFDAVIHLDTTRALEPLEPGPAWESPDLPETYPTRV